MVPDPLGFWSFLHYDFDSGPFTPADIEYAIDSMLREPVLWGRWGWTDAYRRRRGQ